MLLTTLIANLRILANDTTTSNSALGETPDGLNDGSNTHFRLAHGNVVAGSIYHTVNTTYRSQTGVTIDNAAQGLITIAPAPAANANPWYVDYCYSWFLDTDYTEFLNEASRELIGSGDPTTVVDALIAALHQYALGHFWLRRASQYAHKYSSSGGQAGQSVDVVTKNFRELADMAFKRGKQMRDDYYQNLGKRSSPASATNTMGVDPVTPIR